MNVEDPKLAAAQTMPPDHEATRPNVTTSEDELRVAQVKDLQFRRLLDTFKAAGMLLGAIFAFFLLSRPESVISRVASRESLARERAKILLDVVGETDPVVRSLRLELVRSAYPADDSEWIDAARDVLLLRDRYVEAVLEARRFRASIDEPRINTAIIELPPSDDPEKNEQYQRRLKQVQSMRAELLKRGIPLPHVPGGASSSW